MALISWGKLDGNAQDVMGVHDGYIHGSPSWTNGILGTSYDNTAGNAGTGVELIRHNDMIKYEHYWSISLWFMSTTTSGDSSARILSRDCSEYICLTIDQTQSSPQSLGLSNGPTPITNVSVNEGHHFAYTVDVESNEGRVFIDGVLDNTSTVSQTELVRPLVIGGNTEGDNDISGSEFVGKIDDVQFYDHKLSEKEVKELYRGLVGHGKLNQKTNLLYNFYNGITQGGVFDDTNGNFGLKTNNTYSQGYSIGSEDSSAPVDLAHVSPSELNGGEQIEFFEFYWYETSSSTGGGIALEDSSGNEILGLATDNHEGNVHDNAGGIEIVDNTISDYQNGILFRVTFDGVNGQYDYHFEDTVTGDYRSGGPRNLIYNTDVETIRIKNQNAEAWSSGGFYMGFDNITVGLPEAEDYIVDSSGYGNDGTVYGATFSSNNIIGSGCYSFDGTDDYIDLGPVPYADFTDDDFSIVFWARTDGSSDSNQRLFSFGNYSSEGWEVFLDGTNITFRMYDGSSNSVNFGSISSPQSGNHYAITKVASGNVQIYINGSLKVDSGGVNPTSYSGNCYIARYTGGGYHWGGELDDVRIYANHLSQSEIQELYQQRASIDDIGNFYGRELDEINDSTINLTSTGTHLSNSINEVGPSGMVGWGNETGDELVKKRSGNSSYRQDGNNAGPITVESVVIPEDGLYKINYGCAGHSDTADSRHIMINGIEKNSTTQTPSESRCYIRLDSVEGSYNSNDASILVNASEGDTIDLRGDLDTGTSGVTGVTNDSWLSTERIRKGTCCLFYDSSGGQDYDPGTITVNLDSTSINEGGFSLSSDQVTVPKSGWYKYSFTVNCEDTGQGDRQSVAGGLRKNGSSNIPGSESYCYIRTTSAGNKNHVTGHGIINLSSGDSLEIRLEKRYQASSGSSVTIANGNWLELEELPHEYIFDAYESSGVDTIPVGTDTVVPIDTVNQSGAHYSFGSNQLSFDKEGGYEISYCFGWDDQNTGDRHDVRTWLRKNGSNKIDLTEQGGYTRGTASGRLSTNGCNNLLYMKSGDYIELMVNTSATDIYTQANGVRLSAFEAENEVLLDTSGNNNDGTVNGAVISSGLGQSSYSFDGVDDYIDCGNGISLQITESITISAGIKTTATSSNSIVAKGNDEGVDERAIIFGIDNGGYIRFTLDDDGTYTNKINFDSTITVDDDIGHHVAALFDYANNSAYIYIDGSLDNSTTYNYGIYNTPENVIIGAMSSGNEWYFNGKIQDVRIYNRALTPEEINILYNLTNPNQKQRVIQSNTGILYSKNEFIEY